MKFSKMFLGCRKGELYPTQFQPGDECPPELEAAARKCDALEDVKARAKK